MNKKTVMTTMLVIMLLVVAIYFISGTYARYVSEYTANSNVQVAKWQVQVADQAQKTFNVALTVTGNDNVVKDRIAPAVTAKGLVEVDLTGTEVAVELIAEVDETALTEKLRTLGLDRDDLDITIALDGLTKNEGGTGKAGSPYVIPLPNKAAFTAGNGVGTVEVTVKWINDEDGSDDQQDTTVGETQEQLEIPVKLTVSQHIGA